MSRIAPSRLALGTLGLGLVAVASYAVQRLVAASTSLTDPATVVSTVHIPYYWRCDLALLHGGVVALLLVMLVREEAATRWLGRAHWLVPAVVGPALVAMLVVP